MLHSMSDIGGLNQVFNNNRCLAVDLVSLALRLAFLVVGMKRSVPAINQQLYNNVLVTEHARQSCIPCGSKVT